MIPSPELMHTEDAMPDQPQPLWGTNPKGNPVRIPILGLTGENKAGKTLFALTIAPGKFPDGNPRTLYYDFEESGANYDYDQTTRNVQQSMTDLFTTPDGICKPWRPIDVFRWWYDDQAKIKAGQYDVVIIDPITMLEGPLTDYVASQYADHGFVSERTFRATGPLMLAKANEFLLKTLLHLSSRVQTVVFIAHLGVKYVHNKPTNEKQAKGKSPLLQLPTLYLWLEREQNKQTPRCKQTLKDRLVYTSYDPATFEPSVQPYLPPAFDPCTPNKIREYIAKPVNYQKLKKSERVQEDVLSESERLIIEQQIAEDRRIAEEMQMERLNRDTEQVASGASTGQTSQEKKPAQTVDVTGNDNGQQQETPHGHVPIKGRPHGDTVARMIELKQQLGMPLEQFQAGIIKRTGGSSSPESLTQQQADELVAILEAAVAKAGK